MITMQKLCLKTVLSPLKTKASIVDVHLDSSLYRSTTYADNYVERTVCRVNGREYQVKNADIINNC